VEAGAAAVIGGTLNLENRLDVTVSGVFRDLPLQVTYSMDYALPIAEFMQRNSWVDDWGNNGLRMMVRLAPGSDYLTVSDDIRLLIQENTNSEQDVLFLQPLADVYLRNEYENGVLVGGRIDYLRIFSIVGIFVLLIAAINFTNLATARASQRTREVAVRKTFGSERGQLARQFLTESTLMAMIALGVALIALVALLPWFNGLTGKEIRLSHLGAGVWAQFAVIAGLTGLAAGWYPAMHLSSFSVMRVLRRNDYGVGGGINLRRVLVVFQFTISVLLVVGAGAVSMQLDFIRGKNLGLDRKDVFYSSATPTMVESSQTFRARLLDDPAIQSVTLSSSSPLEIGSSTSGGVRWPGKSPDDNTLFSVLTVDHDYLETMRMNLADGRTYSREFGSDSLNLVVNQTAATAMGFEDPVGEAVTMWGRTGQIIGVVEDFHYQSLYEPIDPLVIRLEPEFVDWIFVRPAAGKTSEALAHFESLFRETNPLVPVQTRFLDDQFERIYRSEAVIQTLARGFMLLAIVVACLGLFGLAAFSAARRSKEIGVRKVLGASVPGIVGLLSREFLALVLVALAIALPISWMVMSRWLGQFAYHAELGWPLLLGSALGLIALAYSTVGYQALRAARIDPVHSLRSE
jgi:predicted permease